MEKAGRLTMIKTFKSLDDMESYYNYKTDMYEFIENGNLISIYLSFDLKTSSGINAMNIMAHNIETSEINASNIMARDIYTLDINANNITANNIYARNIKSGNIFANIIKAKDIKYYAFCCAESKFTCNSIKGERPNSKHCCLDSEIIVNDTKYMVNIYELPDLRETLHVLRNQIENPSISTGLDINEATELESILTATLSIKSNTFTRKELLEHFLKCHVKVTDDTMKFIELSIKHGYFQPVKEEKKEKKNAKRHRKQNR